MEPVTCLMATVAFAKDMIELLTLVQKGVLAVRQNQEDCRQLANLAETIQDLLQHLKATKVMEDPNMWKPIRNLRDTLVKAHMLIASCQHSSCAYSFCMGSELADQLRSVQEEMDLHASYLKALSKGTILYELTVRVKDRDAVDEDGAQVHAGSSINNLNRDDSNDSGRVMGGSAKFQLVTRRSIVKAGNTQYQQSQTSRWCCWYPTKETATAPNRDVLTGHKESGLRKFTSSQLAHATSNFSLENKVGFGGSSTVYKAQLHEGLEVAVKRASCEDKIQFDYFDTELGLIPKLQHTNIVKLLGYCMRKDERILVFEYMPNRSLDSFIYGNRATEAPLNWPQRSQIVEGVAQGALYLHKLCGARIIHGDLKPGNILLDADLNSKICDFGISRALKPGSDVDCTTTDVTGSRGFIAPEYKEGGCFSLKSDVYSFGATLLQIISAKKFPPPPIALSVKSRDYGPLNKWAWDLRREGRLMEFIDPSLHDDPRIAEIEKWVQIALLCVQQHPDERPSMWDVLLMLSRESVILQNLIFQLITEKRYSKLKPVKLSSS